MKIQSELLLSDRQTEMVKTLPRQPVVRLTDKSLHLVSSFLSSTCSVCWMRPWSSK